MKPSCTSWTISALVERQEVQSAYHSMGSGDTAKTTRDIIQRIFLGPAGEFGTGLVPADSLVRTTAKPGVADAIEGMFVKHVSGGTSELILKSYDQGREAFQGTNRDLIWLDEEADRSIYVESCSVP